MKLVFKLGLFEGKGEFGGCLKKPTVTVLARMSRAYIRLGQRIRARLGDRTGDQSGG
jgi:hypothetical protein